jgi:hydrogenase maturation protease
MADATVECISRTARILIAGMGNVLRLDDGFGVEAAQQLQACTLPDNVRVVECGISGISLVQEMLEGYDTLILLDAVDRGGEPGTIYVLEPQIDDLGTYEPTARQDFLADMHFATPKRALMLAGALGVLPPRVLVVGCQVRECNDLGTEMSAPVSSAVAQAIATTLRLLGSEGGTHVGMENRAGQ